MTAPKDPRVSTNIRVRADLHERMVTAAEERDVSFNWLITRAMEEFLDRLIPVEELQWTRKRGR